MEWCCAGEKYAGSRYEVGNGLLGRLFLLSYPGEDDAHGGKEPRSAQAVEWLPTLVSQPMFDALGPSHLQAPALVCTQETAFPMVCSFRCSIRCTKRHCRHLHSRPVRHRRTTLLAFCRVSPPPIPTRFTSSITPKRFLLLPL